VLIPAVLPIIVLPVPAALYTEAVLDKLPDSLADVTIVANFVSDTVVPVLLVVVS